MSELPPPDEVLSYWLGSSVGSASQLKDLARKWFKPAEVFDRSLEQRFLPLLETLSAGPLARDWAARGPQGRLAAIIVLDQISRKIFPGSPRAFAQDMLAVILCREGLAAREDIRLAETERAFFYMPLMHSEAEPDQKRSLYLYALLAREARDEFKPFIATLVEEARLHSEVITRFGRFPSRNEAVCRLTRAAELEWMSKGGQL